MLALPGPQYCYNFSDTNDELAPDLVVCGHRIRLSIEGNQGRGTGWSVWDGAVCLALYIEQAQSSLTTLLGEDGGILELGSGTGLAGIAAALALGRKAVLTDLPQVLPSLERNVKLNGLPREAVSVQPLDWHEARRQAGRLRGGPFRLVLAADCVWLDSLVAPFAEALEAVSGEGATVLLAYQSRSARVDARLFSLLDQTFLREPVGLLPGERHRGVIDLYRLTRRPASGE
mmetsp:Transcript_33396/g.79182  ORF Transcript_33396/g.79182 Transcript_33396/m.79182 type:complete len:231 (-) Transcript_33396:231-923(-)